MADDYLHPILSCEQAQRFERALLGGEAAEWEAMQRAGASVAAAVLADWQERSGISPVASAEYPATGSGMPDWGITACAGNNSAERRPRILVLVGKGHNGGDALLAAAALGQSLRAADIFLLRACPLSSLRPLCRRAWDDLYRLAAKAGEGSAVAVTDLTDMFFGAGLHGEAADGNRAAHTDSGMSGARGAPPAASDTVTDTVKMPPVPRSVPTRGALLASYAPFLFCIDGLLGMQFHPPLKGAVAVILAAVNDPLLRIGLRAAVDLPSGIGAEGAFCADFTYATGIAKQPAFLPDNAAAVGRLRYLDIGFFDGLLQRASLAAPTAGSATAKSLHAQSGEPIQSGERAKGGTGTEANRGAPAAAGAAGLLNPAASSCAGSPDPAAALPPAAEAGASPVVAPSPMVGVEPSPAALLQEFSQSTAPDLCPQSVITPAVLEPLLRWRSATGDKRHYGHVMILGGSAAMPGALLFNVRAALHSGAGLVTAFAPESVAAVLAAQAPEAMWVPWPETDEGTLALEGQHELATRLSRASVLLMGSGMGQSRETQALLADIVRTAQVPLVLDADALRPAVLAAAARRTAGQGGVVLTPHAGEFERLCDGVLPVADAAEDAAKKEFENASLRHSSTAQPAGKVPTQAAPVGRQCLLDFCHLHRVVTVLKGARTEVATTQRVAAGLFGGPVLARGGSGDVLAGLLAGCLAQTPQEAELAAHRAVCWHGLAATLLAREKGQVSVTTSELIGALPYVLRHFDCGF